MNYKMVFHILGMILLALSALMLLPLFVGLYYGESVNNFFITIAGTAFIGALLTLIRSDSSQLYAREGFAVVALGWIFISVIGALPFYISGEISSYIDALFESVSGFTTTGSTILDDVEALSKSSAFWRIFTHWIGGMGVLVFVMAVMPLNGGHSMHLMRAEIPGPVVGKLVPRAKENAMILYNIYVALTIVEIILLRFGGMSLYEAVLHAFSTAGTGGFSTRQTSIAAFNSLYIEMVISVFMLLFSINFNLYYLLLLKQVKTVVKNEELRTFFGIVIAATILIALGIKNIYSGLGSALRYAFFNVSAVISTTGFATVDYNTWPEYARYLLLGLMIIGGCAGGTAGGLKLSRMMILVKSAAADLRQMVHPRSVNTVRLENVKVSDATVKITQTYFVLYFLTLVICAMLVSFDGRGLVTSLTASLASISNVGPGLDEVGPVENYADFSVFSKLVLSLEMLMGRLEIYPILMLFYPRMWRRQKTR